MRLRHMHDLDLPATTASPPRGTRPPPARPPRAPPGPARETDDLALAARCRARDPSATRALFERERRRVRATLFRLLGPSPQLDDLVQEVFIAVFRGLDKFRGESSLATWIDRCVVRSAFAHIRRERRGRRRAELVRGDLETESPSAERRALAREAMRRLHETLARLAPNARLAFLLFAVDGRSIREIADRMRSSVVATKSRILRARQFVERRARTDLVLAEYLASVPASSAEPISLELVVERP